MIDVFDAVAVARLSPVAAVDALEAALLAGLDPDADPPRSALPTGAGELLVMPAARPEGIGVKLATVGGDPRVQGVYVLFDLDTLAPVALLDGIALTNLRTAAVSALAVRHLARPDARRLLVFGTGPQARAHIAAVRAVRPIAEVDVVARDVARGREFASAVGAVAVAADPDAVSEADVILCCTTAREPLFDGRSVTPGAAVVAIGSHEPAAREVDEALAHAAAVVVESRAVALREAGDVIQAGLAEADLITLAEVVRGEQTLDLDRPRLFKSVGMAWEDLVVARAVVASHGAENGVQD